MDAKTKKLIGTGTAAELSQLKAQAADALSKGPNADAQEVIEAVNTELERRAKAEPKKVRVKAKEFVLVDGRPWQKDQEGVVTELEYAAYAAKFAKVAIAMLLALVALCFGGAARAQQYPAPVNIGMTNNVPNNSTTTVNLGSTISATKYGEVGLLISFELNAAGTTACTFNFVKSAEAGTNYDSSASQVISVVPNGTTRVFTNVTVTMGPFGYLKPLSVVAANNSAAMTNIIVKYQLKPSRLDGK